MLQNKTCQIITTQPTKNDIHRSNNILNHVKTNVIDKIDTLNAITNINYGHLLTWQEITHTCNSDPQYQILFFNWDSLQAEQPLQGTELQEKKSQKD